MQSPVESMNTSYVPSQPMEIQPPTSRENGPPMESPPRKRQRCLQMDKSCHGNMAPINNFSCESSEESFSSEDGDGVHDVAGSNYVARKKSRLTSSQKEHLKDGYITTSKTTLTSVQKEAVAQKVQSIKSETLIVVAVMSKCNVDSGCFLNFPSHYAKKYLGRDPTMNLQVHGQKYTVRFDEAPQDKRLRSGWKEFVKDNNLKMGDICLFELLSNQRIRTMEVHIIHVNGSN
ncbi:B3 domain-containing protein Os03g0619800-like [Lolium perenne]|uniref:B3 domain-containing protein Os03g0619800-like n=1 Tax=Lolium perenne TaxID=4522 RepID=UPI003A99642E